MIARVFLGLNVKARLCRQYRASFCHKMYAFMLVADKSRFRGVGLGEHQVTYNAEPGLLPCGHKGVYPVLAVETHRQTVGLGQPEHFTERRPQHPVIFFVIGNAVATAVGITNEIRGSVKIKSMLLAG